MSFKEIREDSGNHENVCIIKTLMYFWDTAYQCFAFGNVDVSYFGRIWFTDWIPSKSIQSLLPPKAWQSANWIKWIDQSSRSL
jgi:hypothetical protein